MAANPPAAGTIPGPAGRIDTIGLVPAGFGSLRQQDISLEFRLGGLQVRATPLEESVIRLLAPDSYSSLRGVRETRSDRISTLATRYGVRGFSIWYISFHALEPDVPFSPEDVTISNLGREFRPRELIPLTMGFGQNRLQQRSTQNALYLFDDQVDISQPLVMTVDTERNADWESILGVIERERVLVRGRASRGPPPPPVRSP
jgi:hypothetical protein